MWPILRNIYVAMVLAMASACHRDSDHVVPVQGRLTFQGQPVPNIQIYFHPIEGRGSSGQTSADGSFEMNFTRNRKGALVGTHRVVLVHSPPPETSTGEQPTLTTQELLKYLERVDPPVITITRPETDLRIALP